MPDCPLITDYLLPITQYPVPIADQTRPGQLSCPAAKTKLNCWH